MIIDSISHCDETSQLKNEHKFISPVYIEYWYLLFRNSLTKYYFSILKHVLAFDRNVILHLTLTAH